LQLGAGEDERRFVPPPKFPNPLASDEDARQFLKIWGAWAAARERTIGQWASDLDDLIKLQSATCEELDRYNEAALRHWAEEVAMAHRLISAGANPDDIPMPVVPAVFASELKFVERGVGDFSILHKLPCKRDRLGRFVSKFPDFSRLRVFGKQEQIASAFTPSGGQLAGFFALPVWAVLVITGVVAGTIIVSMKEFRRALTGEDVARMQVEMLRAEMEGDAARSKFQLKCMETSIAALPGDPTAEQIATIRAGCIEDAIKVHPVRKGQEIQAGSIGKGILLGGLGIAAVIGSFAYFRSRQQK
jgi:hypothetical protein